LRVRTTLVLIVAIFALVACGSDKGNDIPTANGSGAAPTAGGTLSAEERKERRLKFAQCMREHGVDMGDPESGGLTFDENAVNKDTMKAATEACKQYIPTEDEFQPPSAENMEQMRKLARCMREHGIANFPDPGPEGLSLGGTGLDPKDPTFKAAEEACKDLRPGSGS
jgi:hypothetical protein